MIMPPILTVVVRFPTIQWHLTATSIYPKSQSMKHGIFLGWIVISRTGHRHISHLHLRLSTNISTIHRSPPQGFLAAYLSMPYPINRAASQMVAPSHQAHVRANLNRRGGEAVLGFLRESRLRTKMTQTSKLMLWSKNPQSSLPPNPWSKAPTPSLSAVIVRISTQE